jgi:hypothetical protein
MGSCQADYTTALGLRPLAIARAAVDAPVSSIIISCINNYTNSLYFDLDTLGCISPAHI